MFVSGAVSQAKLQILVYLYTSYFVAIGCVLKQLAMSLDYSMTPSHDQIPNTKCLGLHSGQLL